MQKLSLFKWIKLNFDALFLASLLCIVFGLHFSKLMISMGQFFMAFLWINSGQVKNQIQSFYKSPLLWALSGLFFIYLLWSFKNPTLSDSMEALRMKLPLLIIPLTLGTIPVKKENWLDITLLFFLTLTTLHALYSSYLICFSSEIEADFRLHSPFVSHIRLSLYVCFSICIALYYYGKRRKFRLLFLAAGLWLLIYLFVLASFTGLFILAVLLLLFLLFYPQKTGWIRLLFVGFFLLASIWTGVEMKRFFMPNQAQKILLYSNNGCAYKQYPNKTQIENGHLIWRNICWTELQSSWSLRSHTPFEGRDNKNQRIKNTLIRYLSSKGYTKDALGINRLSAKDILAIENGVANYRFLEMNTLQRRVYDLLWQIKNHQNGGSPQGSTLGQRIEYAQCAWKIFLQYPLLGVGTGNLQTAMHKQFAEMNTWLQPEFWHKPHNQFLTTLVISGLVGTAIFILSLLILSYNAAKKHWLIFSFLSICFLSFLSDDTLDTQAGVSFYIFFATLLFKVKQWKQKEEN